MSLPKPYYQDDWATIYHADCRLILPHLPKVDLVLTDPPYGINLQNHSRGNKRGSKSFEIFGDIDQEAGMEVCNWCAALELPTVFFASPKRPWPGIWRNYLVWDKGGAVGGGGGDVGLCWKQSWELIQIARNSELNGPRDGAVLVHYMTPADSKLHPAQKPHSLIAYLIEKLTTYGDTGYGAIVHKRLQILDPFMGSGTTLRAAKDLGRKSIGIEIEERYCEIAAKRLAQEVFNFQAA